MANDERTKARQTPYLCRGAQYLTVGIYKMSPTRIQTYFTLTLQVNIVTPLIDRTQR
jgi:hypothetical protein